MRKQKRKNKSNQPSKIKIKKELSNSKKIVFWSLLFFIPVLFFVIVELILQFVDYGDNTKLFVDTLDKEQKIYLNINPDVAKRYFSYNDFVPSPRVNLFHKQKPEGSYRIFVMGGSTAAGYPYGNNLDIARILNRRLSDTFPNKKIEVINLALTAVNTYTVWDFMDEVIEQSPDAILIYAGHNEFYGALGVASMESLGKFPFFVRSFLKLQKFKTFLLFRDVLTYFRQLFTSTNSVSNVKREETAMAQLAKDQLVKYDSDDYELGKIQFKENLSAIVDIAKENDVKVVLSELVSNVKDIVPFSEESEARAIYKEATIVEKNGDYLKAKELYYKAKDLDAIRFRASEDLNKIVHDVSKANKLSVVPMISYFENASPNNLIGNNLMHEHLHPRKNGYFLMADAFYKTMKENNFISKNWSVNNIDYEATWGFTPLDSVHAEMSIIHLMGDWPFVQSGKENKELANMVKHNYVDSLAYRIHLEEDLPLELGHLQLGKYYEERREYKKAMDEYLALTYQMPNADAFYEPAVKLLSKTRNYGYAAKFLINALKYHESPLMYSWIGQFSSAVGKHEQAIKYLELVINDKPNDVLLLFSLSRSYYNMKMIKKGDRIKNALALINPSAKQVGQLKEIRSSITSLSK